MKSYYLCDILISVCLIVLYIRVFSVIFHVRLSPFNYHVVGYYMYLSIILVTVPLLVIFCLVPQIDFYYYNMAAADFFFFLHILWICSLFLYERFSEVELPGSKSMGIQILIVLMGRCC